MCFINLASVTRPREYYCTELEIYNRIWTRACGVGTGVEKDFVDLLGRGFWNKQVLSPE